MFIRETTLFQVLKLFSVRWLMTTGRCPPIDFTNQKEQGYSCSPVRHVVCVWNYLLIISKAGSDRISGFSLQQKSNLNFSQFRSLLEWFGL